MILPWQLLSKKIRRNMKLTFIEIWPFQIARHCPHFGCIGDKVSLNSFLTKVGTYETKHFDKKLLTFATKSLVTFDTLMEPAGLEMAFSSSQTLSAGQYKSFTALLARACKSFMRLTSSIWSIKWSSWMPCRLISKYSKDKILDNIWWALICPLRLSD